MAIEDVAARVVQVLTRAESLFAAGVDTDAAAAALSRTSTAAEAAGAVAARTADISGALVQRHSDVAAASADRLERACGIEHRLVDHLTRSTQLHTVGLTQASGLRAAAAEVPAQLQPWGRFPGQ